MKKQVGYLQRLFYDIWNDFGSVFLLVKYSDKTVIGKRGFTEEEIKNGLVLLFNNKTNTRLEWDGDGNVSCVLAFGTRKEDVFIHHSDLAGVFSPDAGVQFVRSDGGKEQPAAATGQRHAERPDAGQIVSLSDFRKNKKE